MASWYEHFDSSRDMFEDTSDEDHDPTFADSDSEDNASSGSDSDEANDTQNNCPQKQDESHTNCKFKCAISFSHLQQNVLKDEYHKLGYNDQQKWLGKFCRRRTLFRRTMKSPKKKRRPNIDYFLPKGEETIKVCKSFFSATLGFHSTYYYNIKRALDVTCPGGITPPSKKGKYTRPNLLRNKIKGYSVATFIRLETESLIFGILSLVPTTFGVFLRALAVKVFFKFSKSILEK